MPLIFKKKEGYTSHTTSADVVNLTAGERLTLKEAVNASFDVNIGELHAPDAKIGDVIAPKEGITASGAEVSSRTSYWNGSKRVAKIQNGTLYLCNLFGQSGSKIPVGIEMLREFFPMQVADATAPKRARRVRNV